MPDSGAPEVLDAGRAGGREGRPPAAAGSHASAAAAARAADVPVPTRAPGRGTGTSRTGAARARRISSGSTRAEECRMRSRWRRTQRIRLTADPPPGGRKFKLSASDAILNLII